MFFTVFAGTLFALGHHHEVFGRFDVELLALLVTDHPGFFTAVAADTLLWAAGDDLFDPWQVGRQFLAARMFPGLFERQLELLAFTLGLYFCTADPRFELQ